MKRFLKVVAFLVGFAVVGFVGLEVYVRFRPRPTPTYDYKIRSEYDRFKDEGFVYLTFRALKPIDSRKVRSWGFRCTADIIYSEYGPGSGSLVTAGPRKDATLFLSWSPPNDFSAIETLDTTIIFMIDGSRETFMEPESPAGFTFTLTREFLGRIAAAQSVTAQCGTIEFELSAKQREGVGDFLKACDTVPMK